MKRTQSRNKSSNQSSDSDIPGKLSQLPQQNSRNLRRNSISLPSGLNTIDDEAIQQAQIDDKINENVSSLQFNTLIVLYQFL